MIQSFFNGRDSKYFTTCIKRFMTLEHKPHKCVNVYYPEDLSDEGINMYP